MYPDPKTEDSTWIPLAETVRKVAITKKERFLIWKRNRIQQNRAVESVLFFVLANIKNPVRKIPCLIIFHHTIYENKNMEEMYERICN